MSNNLGLFLLGYTTGAAFTLLTMWASANLTPFQLLEVILGTVIGYTAIHRRLTKSPKNDMSGMIRAMAQHENWLSISGRPIASHVLPVIHPEFEERYHKIMVQMYSEQISRVYSIPSEVIRHVLTPNGIPPIQTPQTPTHPGAGQT